MKSFSLPLAALLPVALVNAATQTVQVGQGGLNFKPDSITASQGDVIEFVIHTTHNVARSSFESPCQPISGSQSIWSGENLKDGTIFSVTINDTSPIWLYCATGEHCQEGMAMAINGGSNTIAAYQSAAMNVADTTAPSVIAGGVYGAPSGAASSGSSSASSMTSSMASSMTSSMASSSASSMASTTASSSGSSASSGAASTTTSHSSGASTTTSAAATSSTTNAASNMMADLMMVGGAVLGGAVLIM